MLRRFSHVSLCFALVYSAGVMGTSLEQQRALYTQAKTAMAKGDKSVYLQNKAALASYPLTPHLAYDELTSRLASASNEEIEQFLQQNGDLPQINWMKLRWLRGLAREGDWERFNRYYTPSMNFTELDCLYAQHLQQVDPARGLEHGRNLWLSGKSRPNACDAVFETMSAQGQLPEQMYWERFRLAVEANDLRLANYLMGNLSTYLPAAQALMGVAKKPALIKEPSRFDTSKPGMDSAISVGLRRYSREDTEQALSLLRNYEKRTNFSDTEHVAIAKQIGLTFAKRFDPRALAIMEQFDPNLHDDNVSEWRARLLLRLGRWQEAAALIERFPPSLAQTNRWRYWQARSLQLANNNDPRAKELFKELANERDFYGFMAADQIKAPYRLNHKPLVLSEQVQRSVREAPGIRRALEFHHRGENVEGRREWYNATQHFTQEQQVAQAKLGYDMQWYFPAIRTLAQARYWDDLDIRFPMPFKNMMVRHSRAREINPSWAYAITRQESAFMMEAQSHVGASGLMQLMPATARETAQRYNIPYSTKQQMISPDTNIQLGTAYLSQVYGQFKGNRVLASAAYNAGPGRVRQWLRDTQHLGYDVWVENIPFDETRSYVQNVLTYAVIYGDKLNKPQSLVEWHERYFDGL